MLRALIYEVVITVDRPAGMVTGRVAWEGGATTDIAMMARPSLRAGNLPAAIRR